MVGGYEGERGGEGRVPWNGRVWVSVARLSSSLVIP